MKELILQTTTNISHKWDLVRVERSKKTIGAEKPRQNINQGKELTSPLMYMF